MPSPLIRKLIELCNKNKEKYTLLETQSLTGFTLIEVIVSTLIFSLVILGLFSVFITGNKHIIHTRERVSSAELAKLFIDPLQMAVKEDDWGTSSNVLTNPVAPTTQKVNNRDFITSYTSSVVTGTDDVRRVTTRINWTE